MKRENDTARHSGDRRPLSLDRAIDHFDGELARRGCTRVSRVDYSRKLAPLCDLLPDATVIDVTEDDCRAHLDRWRDRHPNTMRHSISVLRSFFGWLYEIDEIPRSPMDRIKPPRRPNPDDLDVTTVSGADVRRLFDACETWTELLCLSTLAYLGPRRRAASNVRRRDVDLDRGTIRFREKGGKVITKPIPEEFAGLLRIAMSAGAIGASPDSYVIPMLRGQRREGDRDDRIIWRTVKNLGERAGVEVHPHALRAAFAVQFLETHRARSKRCSGLWATLRWRRRRSISGGSTASGRWSASGISPGAPRSHPKH